METYPAFRSSTLRIVPPAAARPVDAATLYAPPYDSALADGFAWNLVKYLAPAFDLSVEEVAGGTVVTLTAPATRPDRPPRFVSFAFAALSYSTAPADSERVDDAVQETGDGGEERASFVRTVTEHVPPGVLYVLRPEDIVHRLPDVLALMAKWDPALFTERGAINLERLSSDEARARRVTPVCTQAVLSYADLGSASCLLLDTETPVPETLVVQRMMRPRSSSTPHAARVPEDTPCGPTAVQHRSHPHYARSA